MIKIRNFGTLLAKMSCWTSVPVSFNCFYLRGYILQHQASWPHFVDSSSSSRAVPKLSCDDQHTVFRNSDIFAFNDKIS
jgi:hypothetical protein